LMCWANRCKIRFARSFKHFWNICVPFSDMLLLITSSSYTSVSLRRFSIEKKVPRINRITLQNCPGAKFPLPLLLHVDLCPE
jgi:hypothetical protein